MKRVQGQNLFTLKSLAENKPKLRPEIEEKVNALLDSIDDGQTVWLSEGEAK